MSKNFNFGSFECHIHNILRINFTAIFFSCMFKNEIQYNFVFSKNEKLPIIRWPKMPISFRIRIMLIERVKSKGFGTYFMVIFSFSLHNLNWKWFETYKLANRLGVVANLETHTYWNISWFLSASLKSPQQNTQAIFFAFHIFFHSLDLYSFFGSEMQIKCQNSYGSPDTVLGAISWIEEIMQMQLFARSSDGNVDCTEWM